MDASTSLLALGPLGVKAISSSLPNPLFPARLDAVVGDPSDGEFYESSLDAWISQGRFPTRNFLSCVHTSGVFPDRSFLYELSLKLNFLLNLCLSLSGAKKGCPSSELTCLCESEPQIPAPLPRAAETPGLQPFSLMTGLEFPRQGAVIKPTVRSH